MMHGDGKTDCFDWDAFVGDTLEASVAATGAWLRCLYKMRRSATRGRLSWPIASYARLFGTSQDQAKAILTEISDLGIGDAEFRAEGQVVLTNRRLFRAGQLAATHGSCETEDVDNKEDAVQVTKTKGNSNLTPNLSEINKLTNTTAHMYSSPLDDLKPLKLERKKKKYVESEVAHVFTYWQTTLNHPKALLTTERAKAIRARLRDGYTPEQLKRAIDGCKASAYHQGQNDSGTIYDSIGLIFRNGEKVEQFMGYLRTAVKADKKPAAVGKYEAPSGCEHCGGTTLIDGVPCRTCDRVNYEAYMELQELEVAI